MARTKTAAKRQAAGPAPKPAAAPSRATKAGGASGGKPVAQANGAAARSPKGTKPAPAAKSTSNGQVRGSTSAAKSTAKSSAPSKRAPTRAVRGTKSAARGGARKSASRKSAARRPAAPVVRVVRVKQLDPVAKCGPSTSVEQLFRVDEEANGEATVHLVFFDRHGWYCVHGPRCAAVADVHSHTKTVQRARAGGR